MFKILLSLLFSIRFTNAAGFVFDLDLSKIFDLHLLKMLDLHLSKCAMPGCYFNYIRIRVNIK